MAINPALISTVVGIGVKLYEFVDKVSKGAEGDQLKPVLAQLEALRASINSMGADLRLALDGAVDQIIGDIRLTQLARLPGAHAAIADYQRTHPDRTGLPDVGNPNYVTARTTTLDVKNYFLGHHELAFMGGFIDAMNARIAFMVGTDDCWSHRNPEYVGEIQQGIAHLSGYIAYIKSRISAGFVVKLTTKFAIDNSVKPPQKEPVSYTATVTGDTGTVLFTKTVPATDDQPTKVHNEAKAVRNQRAAARQAEVMGVYDQILARWNGLVGSSAATAMQRALLPGPDAEPLSIENPAAAVTALHAVVPDGERNGSAERPTGFAVPLRELAMQVLASSRFQERHQRLLRRDGQRMVEFWVRTALQRDPSADEAAALTGVLTHFGATSFFHALAYSGEYEGLWGAGVPNRAVPTESVSA